MHVFFPASVKQASKPTAIKCKRKENRLLIPSEIQYFKTTCIIFLEANSYRVGICIFLSDL